ncbi:MAG: cytochrome P460 family protein [Hyphomicrobiaceae bacterium]
MLKLVTTAAAGVLFAGSVFAGAEKVSFPEGYQTHFVRYATVDNAKRKKARFFYVNPESLAKAEPGQPVPSGTVLVMEDRGVKLGADGTPLIDSRGRFIPTSEILNVFVQEKQPGWGAEYDSKKRNGEWEYAWFDPAGKLRRGAKVNYDGCFACHKERAEANDYNFTFSPFIKRIKQ